MNNLLLNFYCAAARRNTFRSEPTVHVQEARLPEGVRVYGVGDGHGAVQKFRQLRTQINRELDAAGSSVETAYLVLNGDNVDKSGNPKAFLNEVEDVRREGRLKLVYVHGNHERWFHDFLTKPGMEHGAPWINNYGGNVTLHSYGLTDLRKGTNSNEGYARLQEAAQLAIPASHKELLNSTVPHFTLGDFHFVHVGVDPRLPLSLQADAASNLNYAEKSFLTHPGLLEKVVVHGHYTSKSPEVRPHRIGIDTGAHKGGPLTAVVLEGGVRGAKRRFLQSEP